jgi:PIN domain nuclease of toxin-antitoxin system
VILLDTHVWVWWVSEPDKLSARARAAIDYARAIGISPISAWEIATKAARGRLRLDRDPALWVLQALARPRVELTTLTAEIAVAAGRLGDGAFHGDPADRMITATAIAHGAELVTKDERIRAYPGVRTLW